MMCPHYNENMLEVGADILWCKRLGTRLLKHDSDDIIADVALSQQLWIENKDMVIVKEKHGQLPKERHGGQ